MAVVWPGQVPFRRDQEAAVMYAHLKEPPPKLSIKRPGLPEALDSVIAKGMAKRPEDRYRSAGALARGMQDAVSPFVVEPRPGGRRSKAWIRAAGVVVIIVVAAIAAIVDLSGRPHRTGIQPSPSNPSTPFGEGVFRIDPVTDQIVAEKNVEGVTGNLVDAYGFVWLSSHSGLLKFSPASGNVVHTIDPLRGQAHGELCFAGSDCGVAFGAGKVWFGSLVGFGQTLGIDPKTNGVRVRVTGPGAGAPMVFYAGRVWVADPGNGKLFELNPKTGKVEKTLLVESTNRPSAIAGGEGAVWVVNGGGGTLTRVDPISGDAIEIPLEHPAEGVAAGEGGVWVTDGSGSVTEWNSDGKSVLRTIPVGDPTGAVAVGGGYVWVVTDRFVARIDPATGPIKRIPVRATAISVGGDGVWATSFVNTPGS